MKKFDKSEISKIIDYYKTHSDSSTAGYFHIKVIRLKKILEENNIIAHTAAENKCFQVKQLKETCLIKFGVTSNLAQKEIYLLGQQKSKEKALSEHGVEYSFQSQESIKKRNESIKSTYSKNSDEIIAKREATCTEKYGSKAYSQTSEWKIRSRKSWLDTVLKKYGCLKEFYSLTIEKGIATKSLNGSFGTNACEDLFFDYLCNYFKKDDIHRQYRDSRYCRADGYKYRCDFYIKPIDTFIELNLFETHYFEPFDCNNKEHLLKLHQCKTSPKNWVDSALVNVWAKTDVEKKNCATSNGLNYIQLYFNDFKKIIKNYPPIDEILGISLISNNQYAKKIS